MAQETYMPQSSAENSHLDVFHSENTLHINQKGAVTITVPGMRESCIHQVFAQRVRERPDSEAVCGWDQQFSYSELDTLSSRLAFRLISLNVGSEVLVPLCFEKSAWTIVAMMAVLKAGAAFVPLDPSYPVKRLEQIIRQTGANLILTSPQYTDLCRPLTRTLLPVCSSTFDELPAPSDAAPFSSQPRSAAYVIFTSGSTGRPKGVVIEHRAFCACAVAHGPAHRIESTSRVLQFASYSFDASLVEILTTLMSGGCCCVPSATDRVNDLARAMHELRVDLAILTPTVAALLAPKAIPQLKTLVMIGETMKKSQIRDWADIPHLLCAYGPTEASVSATVNSRVTEAAGPANLGVPVGCHIWITDPDDHNRLLPKGEIGEALIEGPNLARGYLNDPERTRAAFIDDTTWQKPGQRFYKTGDLMRRNVDGTLDFVGRKDMQIKIRGQRVETEEIEQCLAGEDGVSQTAVVWPNSGPYACRLVGIVCLETLSNKMVDSKDLRLLRGAESVKAQECLSRLMARAEVSLPSFMVPAVILPVEAIPLLLSGKVNRAQIIEWIGSLDDETSLDIQTRKDDRDRLTARTKLELTISQIWAKVLNIPSDLILLDKSFLSYGGDSVSAIQVVSKCREKGMKLAVQDILKWKTISRLLPHVEVSVKFTPIPEESIEKLFKLSPIQQMFFEASPNGENHFNQSFLLRAKRVIKSSEMQQTLEAVVKRHSMLRARFTVDKNGSWVQKITNNVSGSYRFQCHKSPSFDTISPILNSRQESLDITNGPVFICDLFYTKQGCFVSVIAHHVVVDLVSWRIIFDDLEQSLKSGDSLPDVPVSFQNWCILQAEYSQEHLTPGAAYPFAVEPPDLEFWKMDIVHNFHRDTREEVFELDEELTTSLLRGDDCHRALRTEPMDLFLSALFYSFREAFPERETPSIHLEGHGREVWDSNIDISQTVGWFTTLCPLHIPIGDKDTIIDVVRFTKDVRRAIPHKGWGHFASRYLNPEGRKTLAIAGPMEFVFNYSGLYQQLERPDRLLEQVESSMQESAAKSMTRFSLFEVNACVEQGRLRFSFKFNSRMAHQERIQKWTISVKQCLKDLAESIRQLPVQYTLSDFSKARLTYGSLNTLAKKVSSHPGMTANVDIEDIYPCSPMQQGILISQAKGSASYNTHTMWEVESSPGSQRVDMERLEHAWRQVVSRHPCLRTIFVENVTANESFHQVVLKNIEVKVAKRQWESKSLELHHLCGELNGQAQPPLQFTIYEAENGRVFSSLNISHLVMDGLSIDNIVRDILLAYDDRLPPAPASSYGDYISLVRGQTDTKSLQFWKVRLADLEPCLFPSLEVGSEMKKELRSMRSMIPPSQAKKLWEFCEKENYTMSTLFQLAWAIVLQSYVGTDDVCFGYLVSGRDVPLPGIEDLVGAFSNVLICRTDLSKVDSISSALGSMQTDALMCLEHEFCSLGDVHNALGVPALFNTIISYQRHEVSKVAVKSSIEFEKIGEYDPSEYDLAVGVHVFDGKIFVKMDYQSELLSRGHAEHIIDTLNTVLSAFVNSPSQDIRTVNRISNKGRDAILSFTAPELERATECIHSAIKQQVAYCPEASAIEAWDVSFSYAKLYNISFLVAKDLLEIGLGPQMVVPLLFEKSGWTTVAMLAVMLAGGIFVLLDPSHPRARLEEIIAQLSPTIVISSRQQKELASSFIETVFDVGPDIVERSREPEKITITDNLRSTDAAFIIFTSGSTGKPKGVVIEHSAFVSAAKAHSGPLEMTNSSRVLQFASYSFDACLLEILTTLISGGTVCVPTDADRSSNLPKTMLDLEITWANLTPLVADILLKEYLPCLQTLVVAGEAMTQDQIRSWANSSTHLINGYGPTEASVAATLNLDAINSVPSNIGHPVGCRVWILDSCQNLVPPGALGQLFIDGPTLARGYFGDPEKTAAAFIEPPPWLETKYPHIYMTGDLVRYSLDGSMSFVGRKDTSQVKIRGQRVEVSEVEDGVRSHLPDHGQVAVVFRKFLAGRGQLIAFIVLPGQSLEDTILEMDETTRYQFCEIRQSLLLSLPRYMVPDMFIPLTKMPLKLSGKLDRAYLRELVDGLSYYQKLLYSLAEAVAQEVAPQTGTEKTLQRLWCAVLGIGTHQIRAQSDFFKIGGDSVLAMKLTANAHNEGLFLTVSAVFQHPTLQAMAAYLDSQGSLNEIPMVNIEPFTLLRGIRGSTEEICTSVALQCALSLDKIHDIYPCTPLQEGLIALSMKQPGCYVAQYVLQLPSGLDVDRFKAAWEKVVATTEVFRTRIVVNGLTILQAVVEQNIHWEHSQIQESPTTAVHNMKPIQLGVPLQHFEILEGPEAYFFRLTVHHAIYDGWSLFLMFKQVEVLYDGQSPQHLTPFNRFIAHLAEVNGDSSEYWGTQFLGANIHHFPDPVHDGYTCRGHESITRKLKDVEVVGTGVTPSTILRAAWAITIARVTVSNDVLFGVVLSGRNVPIAEATRIVGPTITTVPIRVKLDLSQPISDFLQDLQKHATEMIPHEHTGLQAIKNYSKNKDAASFTSVIVVQSKDTDIDSIKFMGSEIVHVMNADFDTYPLVLEYRPGVKAESILCARYDKQMISSEKMEAVLEDYQFVLQQISGKIDAKIGDLVVFEDREEEHHHTSNTDTQSLKEKLESTWKESRLQTPFQSYKPLDFRPSTEPEKQLQKLWSRLLGTSTTRIGLEDNFFRLGGDSIAAIKLTAAARVQNISLPVATIFNNPTLSEMAKEMKTTNGNEQTVAPFALIESSETDVLESVALQCGVTAGQIEDLYSCTPLQEGLMALSTKQPGAYVAQYIFRVPHSIDLEHFKKAWNSTSQLHTILRTRIILQGSLMLQVVVKEATKFENHSTVDLDEFLRKNTLKTGFGARLSRFIIVQTADGGQYFVLLLHHTTFDAWSLPTLFDSVTRFYEKRLVSKPTPYSSFIDYILNDNKESMALFWATYLKALDTSHFPQLPSPNYTPSETKTVRRSISISRPSESQITTSTLLRGAWAVTLGNYSNCKDVVFCTTLSGRNTPLQGITGITGPTIATVPIRIDVDLNQSSKDFLQAIQSQTAAMIPFEQYGLQNIRRISTDAMKACDAPSLLVIQTEAEDNKDNRLLGLDPILTPVANISSYPLAIECKIGNGCVDVFGYYDDSIVSEIQMHRIQHHFEHVLRQLGEESLDLLRELSKVSSYDYNVLEKWNKEVPQVIEKCIHEITHKQAIATPDAPAVWAWDVKWSHAELDRLSSCLAYDLIHVGVKSEAIVPMCFERSGWVVVAMLGILKAGGAFLPWDPAHPEERRKEMIRQTGSEVIVTSKQTAVLCSGLAKTTFVVDPASFEGRDVELEPHKDPHTAAYVIYTSGSTGKPKGVVIEHKAYTTSAIAHGPVHRIHSKSRVAQFASYSVDAICLEIITSIMMGGCTCICSDSRRNNGLGIALNEMGVTVAALTPSVLSLMSPEELPHLETVIMVGEPAPPALVERWRIFFHLINGYGPTETSLSAVMNEKMTAAAGSNIGHAVGCVTWIADMYNHDRLVPIGCIGELIIEGPTLARGYLHDEKKTSQAFVANPGWLERCGSKLYKTGDLVRYDPDGTIVFVGRKDMQVKLNGHRIELGEIEHHIMRALHFVQQAVVETITTDDARVLVAIIVIKDTQETLNVRSAEACTMTPALQLHLQTIEQLLISTLPTYMVPNLWIPMNAMPFASSGKVDRKRLQELATVIWNTQRTQYALSDGTKREPMGLGLELRKMWSTVLNLPVEEISADDNFFHIGADSIAAMKLAGYASKQGWELSVASIFHTPILDGMAKILVPGRRLLEEAPKPFSLLCNANIGGLFKELRSQLFDPECEIEDVMPSTDFQAWAVSYGSINAGFITYMNLIPAKELDEDRLERACRDVVASHPILRTTFVLYQNEILQVVLKYPLLHFERIKCVESIDVTWHQWFQKQKQLRLGENIIKFAFLTHKTDQRLVMRISHAQYDGISFPSIWKALSQAYAGQDILPSRPFSTFISAITDKTDAREYWKDLLANSKMTSISSNFSPSYNRPLDQTIERTIDLPSIHPDYTLATVIKASWSIVLSHIAKESDLVFGSLVSGRSLSLDRVVGPCLNIVPVRVRLDPSCTVLELLRQIQNQQLASIPFETLGFREIAKVTNWHSSTRYSSVVQHQNIPELKENIFFDGVECEAHAYRDAIDTSDIEILSMTLDGKLKVEIGYCEEVISQPQAKIWLEILCRLVGQLSDSLDAKVANIDVAHFDVAKGRESSADPTSVPAATNNSTRKTPRSSIASIRHFNKLESKLKSLWHGVLDKGQLKNRSSDILPSTSFFSLPGADLVSACILASRFQQEGYDLTAREVIDNDTLEGQAMLIEQRGGRDQKVMYYKKP